jgi:hypothetical protein
MINLETDIILAMLSAAIGVRPICQFGFYSKTAGSRYRIIYRIATAKLKYSNVSRMVKND